MAVRKRCRTRATTMKTAEVKNKMRPIDPKTEKNKNLIIAQEIKMARLLANNDKKVRDKVLKRLKKWLTIRSQSSFAFTKTDFMSLWKGLFYCMWMSDKMLIQEELAESLSKLVHCFNSKDTILLYTSCALRTLAIEWFGIDQYRLDKFAMLVRKILRETFVVCKDKSWDMKWVTELSQMFLELLLHPKTSLGFNLHMTEIYLEELAKISNGNIPECVVYEFIKPFVIYLMTTDDERQMKHIMRHVFRHLIFQSDIGLDYMEKFDAWKKAGFPCARVDDMQKIEIDTEENENDENDQLLESEIQDKSEKPLDPRAGRVNVDLPQIPFNAAKIVKMLSEHYFYPSSKAKSRRQLTRLIEEFKELSEGRMPLGIKKVRKPSLLKQDLRRESRKATSRLLRFEKKLFSDNINKKQKKKKGREVIASDTSSHNLKNGNHLDSNSDTNTIDSDSESIDTTVNMKANSQRTNTNIAPCKKQKRKRNREIIASDTSADDNQKNEEFNSIMDTVNSEGESIDSFVNINANLQNTDSDIVPPKKRKRNLTCDKLDNKHVINEDKEKLKIKTHKKLHKTKKIKLNHTEDTLITDNNVESKLKKTVVHGKHKGQSTFISTVSKKKNVLEKGTRSEKSLVSKKTMPGKNIIHNDKETLLKDESSDQTKKPTNLNNSLEKKKVVFSLLRNTAQHTSEYLQQIRKSPAIPFDASKKPLASVLKSSPISSPLNPFYKKKI